MKRKSATPKNTAPPFELQYGRPRLKSPTPADDARLLQAARDARLEAGNFETLFRTVAAINGALEVLSQMVRNTDTPPDDLNWNAVGDLLNDARRRIIPVYSATCELSQYERAAGSEAADVA